MRFRVARQVFVCLAASIAATVVSVAGVVRQIPLTFEENRGQFAPEVRFVGRGGGATVFLMGNGAVWRFGEESVRMSLQGSSPEISVEGLDRTGGVSNYFHGNDPSRWQRRVAQFGRVGFRGAYPGIDAVIHGTTGETELDFEVSPGADPGAIRLAFEGGGKVRVTRAGDLTVTTREGELRFRKPTVYQGSGGCREIVPGSFVRERNGEVRFRVGRYDRGRTLVIDPVLRYSTYLGGTGNDKGYAIAVDAQGFAYVTGQTASDDFPSLGGVIPRPGDAFVTKLTPDASAIVYSTFVGGTGSELARGIAIGLDGTAFVAGETHSYDFPVTSGALQASYAPGFVARLSPLDGDLLVGTYFGGTAIEVMIRVVAIARTGAIFLCGETTGLGFPTTTGAFQETTSAPTQIHAFVSKLDSRLSILEASTFLGGSHRDSSDGIGLDSDDNVYVCGGTNSTDFPTTPNAFQSSAHAGWNAFVVSLPPDLQSLRWGTYFGGSRDEGGSLDGGHYLSVDPLLGSELVNELNSIRRHLSRLSIG